MWVSVIERGCRREADGRGHPILSIPHSELADERPDDPACTSGDEGGNRTDSGPDLNGSLARVIESAGELDFDHRAVLIVEEDHELAGVCPAEVFDDALRWKPDVHRHSRSPFIR